MLFLYKENLAVLTRFGYFKSEYSSKHSSGMGISELRMRQTIYGRSIK